MTKIVDVAAAVFLRDGPHGTEFLLAQRPPDKVYAGYWEFPGGKLEAGENFHDALVREIEEELGVTITRAWPWLSRRFTYPHATVRLKFFRVSDWVGDISPIEHTGVVWVGLGEAPAVSPVLPANGPILQALALPHQILPLCPTPSGFEAGWNAFEHALENGIRHFHVDPRALHRGEAVRFVRGALLRLRNTPDARLLIVDNAALADETGADGLHLSAGHVMTHTERPSFPLVSASCHTSDELERAETLELDYVRFGPACAPDCRNGLATLGWAAFERHIAHCSIPVFAQGGLGQAMLETAWQHGAHGITLARVTA